ncbi:coenzyme A transporter [Rhodotorula kratochvilovae]
MAAAAPTASTSSVRLEDAPAPRAPAPPPAAQLHSPSPDSQPARKRKRHDRDSLAYVLTSGFAGGIAGCVAKTSVAPLDRVKILFQTRNPDFQKYAGTWLGVFRASRDIYAETGLRGLLQGHSATLLRIFPYAAIKFMAYDQLHTMLMPTPADETSARRFLAGSTAGIITTGITYPLELIRVRLAFESHHSQTDRASLLRTIRAIYEAPPPIAQSSSGRQALSTSASSTASSASAQPSISAATAASSPSSAAALPSSASPAVKPSIAHFYRGVWPTLVGIIPYAGTSFLMWGFLKTDLMPAYLSPSFRARHRAALDLLAGGIAGAIGQTTAYPLDIVRRRMQVGPVLHADGRGRAGFWETARGVYRTAGPRGFFVGLSIGYLKVGPMNAVSFATWVAIKRVLGLDEDPSQAKVQRDEPEEARR